MTQRSHLGRLAIERVRAARAAYNAPWRQALRQGGAERRLAVAGTALALAALAALALVSLRTDVGNGITKAAVTEPTAVIVPAETAAPLVATAAAEIKTHTVQPGDTLWDIAIRHGTTVAALVAANNLDDPNLLAIGQRLVIPGPQ